MKHGAALRSIAYAMGACLAASHLSARQPTDGVAQTARTSATSELTLVPGQDYALGELLLTFRETYVLSSDQLAVAARSARFAAPVLDAMLAEHRCTRVMKLVARYGWARSDAGRFLERTFLLEYEDGTDPQALAAELARLPIVEEARVNRILEKEYFGTRRLTPSANTRFDRQWYFHHPTRDRLDIDAPEAWAIESGDPSVIVVVNDSGTMVDTTSDPSDWKLHSDFTFYWTAEDTVASLVLNGQDLNFTDSPADADPLIDNVIGYNWEDHWEDETDPYVIRFWHSVPTNWLLPTDPVTGEIESSQCILMYPHGLQVASIAAAGFENGLRHVGGDISGAAPSCKVYIVRSQRKKAKAADDVAAIIHGASVGRVMNMSWGFRKPLAGQPEVPKDYWRACKSAVLDYDCVLTAATGNEHYTDYVSAPARYEWVLGVGAVDTTTSGSLKHCSGLHVDSGYSNYDSRPDSFFVDLVAPVHSGIWADGQTECPQGVCPCVLTETASKTGFGTSFAAPQVAGVAALVRSRFPSMTALQVMERLKRTADFYPEWYSEAFAVHKYGAGKVNAYRALTEWGSITGNVTWDPGDPRDGTYYISGDLTIDSTAVLTINAGTVVKVAPDHEKAGGDTTRVEIIVRDGGTLNIEGTSDDPVVFGSFTDSSPTNSDWVGITFESGSHGILENVVIDNATQDVEVAGYNISVADWDENKTFYLDSTLPVTDDLTIGTAETLYVLGESPVAVTGGSSIGIDVNGTLVCRGTTNDKPEFTATTAVPGAWDGIAFGDSSQNNVLEHFIVRHAVTAIQSEVPLSIEDVTLSDGSEGIEAHADVEVATGSISDFTAYGVEVLKGHTTLTDVTITGCGMGIALGGYQQSAGDSTSVSASGCTIASPDFHGVTTSTYDHRYLSLDETEITDAYYGVSVISATTADIRDCTFHRNDSGILLLADPKAIAVRSSVIDTSTTSGVYCVNGGTNYYLGGNTIQANPVGVLCLNASPLIQNGNSITGNTTGIQCDAGSSPVIEWNTISANTTGVWTLNGSNPDLGHATGGSSIGNNTFSGNTSYHVRHQTVSTTLVAENNWWGSSSGPDPGKISGSVDYDPWLTSAPASPPSPAPPAGEDREEELATEIPDRLDLSPGYPNPFNPSVTLRVQVPRPGSRVTVVLYNVRGEAVRTLLDEYRAPGTHVLTWNGRTDTGEAAATGVYFARMQAPGYVETRKIVLIK